MDPTVSASLNTALTGMKTDAMTQLGTYVPIAVEVLVAVGLTFFTIKIFRALIHI